MTAPYAEAMDLLTRLAGQIGVNLTPRHEHLIADYCGELAKYNQHTNLVSKAEPEFLVKEHVLDSLTLVRFIELYRARLSLGPEAPPLSLVDVGSGAGFPGLILAMVVPRLYVTLVESVGKKARFLEEVASTLGLDNVAIISDRAEELGRHQYRETFDMATARAVGSFEMVTELTIPLLRVHGQLFVQKSIAQLDSDLKTAARVLSKLGSSIIETTALDQRVLGKDRAVIVVEKNAATSHLYPRSWARIKSHPLGAGKES